MNLIEYVDALMDELERRNFHKLINYYVPPEENFALWLLKVAQIGLQHNQSVEQLADIIEREFAIITNALFPTRIQ